jgi:hypothetical protein
MSAAKKRTRAEKDLADQQRLTTILHEAHDRLELWRMCSNESCFRIRTCNGDVDQCGARTSQRRVRLSTRNSYNWPRRLGCAVPVAVLERERCKLPMPMSKHHG